MNVASVFAASARGHIYRIARVCMCVCFQSILCAQQVKLNMANASVALVSFKLEYSRRFHEKSYNNEKANIKTAPFQQRERVENVGSEVETEKSTIGHRMQ